MASVYMSTHTNGREFRTPFREAKFCGVPSYVFEKLGCAAGKKNCGTLL
jgi:hypothetical protein